MLAPDGVQARGPLRTCYSAAAHFDEGRLMLIRTPPVRPRLYRGWLVLGACFGTAFGSVVFFNPILGVFVRPLEADLGWNRAEVAIAVTAGGLLGTFVSPVFGWLMDRHGGRVVIPPATILMTLLLVALAATDTLWQFIILYATGRALAVGAVNPAAFTAVSNWFIRRRPLAVALVALGPRISMATLPVFTAIVISAAGGWRAGWLALAVVIATFSIVPPALLMHRRPEDIGLEPDGDNDDKSTPIQHEFTEDFRFDEAVRTRSYWLLGLSTGLLMFAGGAINFHQIPYLEDQGLSGTTAALTITVFSLTGAVGGLGGGAIATRLTTRWTMVGGFVGMAGGVLLLLLVNSTITALFYAVVYGIFFGATVTMNQAIYAEYFGRLSLGVIRGSHQPFQLTLNAAGPLVTGLWFEWVGSYDLMLVGSCVVFIAAAAALGLAPRPLRS